MLPHVPQTGGRRLQATRTALTAPAQRPQPVTGSSVERQARQKPAVPVLLRKSGGPGRVRIQVGQTGATASRDASRLYSLLMFLTIFKRSVPGREPLIFLNFCAFFILYPAVWLLL
jgi:hypothetical protein